MRGCIIELCTLHWKECVKNGKEKSIWRRFQKNDCRTIWKQKSSSIKREYGVAEATLYRWIKEYGKIKTSNNETTTNHEIKRLKKELAQAKESIIKEYKVSVKLK